MLNVHHYRNEATAIHDAADAIEALAEQLIGKARQLRNNADSADWTDAETAVRFANQLTAMMENK
jgi:hypothetical protein